MLEIDMKEKLKVKTHVLVIKIEKLYTQNYTMISHTENGLYILEYLFIKIPSEQLDIT